jgi:outer membrane lipopolysaccharide assembly protein LptE/RlpB
MKDVNKKVYDLSLTTRYNKNIKSKDAAGLAKEYELVITVDAIVKSELIDPKKLVFKETFNMKKFEDSFEEKNYEKIMKENLSDIILDRIIMYLFKL